MSYVFGNSFVFQEYRKGALRELFDLGLPAGKCGGRVC